MGVPRSLQSGRHPHQRQRERSPGPPGAHGGLRVAPIERTCRRHPGVPAARRDSGCAGWISLPDAEACKGGERQGDGGLTPCPRGVCETALALRSSPSIRFSRRASSLEGYRRVTADVDAQLSLLVGGPGAARSTRIVLSTPQQSHAHRSESLEGKVASRKLAGVGSSISSSTAAVNWCSVLDEQYDE